VRRHLNTLYVTTQGAYLSKDGANVVVAIDGAERARVPIHTLGGLVGFGRVALSPPLLGFCAEAGVAVTFLSEQGKFLARVEGPVSGNVLLRREQYRRTDDPDGCAAIVRSLVIGKALNQRAERPQSADTLRGLEGEAANVYFGAFDALIRAQNDDFRFDGRSRRPPLDPVNALLSFVYALLVHDVRSALETVGLDPAVGFLHRDRPGRPSLALDLMEEFRPFFADRLVLSLINRRQVSVKGFRRIENGACLMTDELRRDVLVAYQERKREELRHPYVGEPTTVGLLWYLQAQLLARHLRGDLDGYPPFVWK
jgi:CRISPR-associated protein Cas1